MLLAETTSGSTAIALYVGIATGVVSLATAFIGIAAYLRAGARKEYASERDIGHVKNHLAQLSLNIEQLWRLQDEKWDAVARQLDKIENRISER